MKYNGDFDFFDFSAVKTYPIRERKNKVRCSGFLEPEQARKETETSPAPMLDAIVRAAEDSRSAGQPVILFTGAHLIKNGLSLLLAELVKEKAVTLVATNGAGMIHDLEIALIGETSETVPRGLRRGRFGMCRETAELMNRALAHGNRQNLGAGESLGALVHGEPFPEKTEFPFRKYSLLNACRASSVPFTMHAGIGTDIIDQHASFDGEAKGGCSARDFGIFAAEVAKMTRGGVFINIGSAVTGPEVLLKACSMAANIGRAPCGITTAVFDLRPAQMQDVTDEKRFTYYFRDIKSVASRIPEAFGGKGFYIRGDQKETFPAFFRKVSARLSPGNSEKNKTP